MCVSKRRSTAIQNSRVVSRRLRRFHWRRRAADGPPGLLGPTRSASSQEQELVGGVLVVEARFPHEAVTHNEVLHAILNRLRRMPRL